MITITVKGMDRNGKTLYRKFQRKEDRVVNSSDIERLEKFIYAQLREGNRPEIKSTIMFNRYVGVVSGFGGCWHTIINEEKAKMIIVRTLDEINKTIINNANMLGGRV